MSTEIRKQGIQDWLASIGYPAAALDTPMQAHIAKWHGYLNRSNDFYKHQENDVNGKPVDIVVRSCGPATLIDSELASLIYNEEASITVPKDLGDDGNTNGFLQQWLSDVRWHETAPLDIEDMCDLGTVGWALHVNGAPAKGQKSNSLSVVPVTYDAPNILPLAWNQRQCIACAFTSTIYSDGDELTQIEVHRPDAAGSYEILCAVFGDDGKPVTLPGMIGPGDSVNTGQPTPTFALAKLAKRNKYWPHSPMGVSLFDDLTDVLETVDLAFDSLGNDIILGRKLLAVPASMLRKTPDGKMYTPWQGGQQFFMAQEDANIYDGKLGIYEYNPSLRSEENRSSLETAFQVLGMRAGFGTKYFALDSQGGITTAKEVASDNAALMRTLRRHEKPVREAITTIMEATVGIYATLSSDHAHLADVRGKVNVVMGDSIMEDTDSMREADRADVAAGLLEPWKYMVRWQGYTDEEAKAACEGMDGIPIE